MVELYSVCQFFPDGSYEYTRERVFAEEAVNAAIHYATSVGALIGTTRRVIITDGGDSVVWEWKWEEGIVFPSDQPFSGKLKKGLRS